MKQNAHKNSKLIRIYQIGQMYQGEVYFCIMHSHCIKLQAGFFDSDRLLVVTFKIWLI